MAKVVVDTVLTKAQQVLLAWEANPDFQLGTMTLDNFKAELQKLTNQVDATERARLVYTDLVNQRDDQASVVSDLVTRTRSGFRAFYGPDSSQYELVGGVRRSERKSPSKTPKS